jgi:hypothetical protein
MNRKRAWEFGAGLGLLLALTVVGSGFWSYSQRQQHLEQEMVKALRTRDEQAIIGLLQQGASTRARMMGNGQVSPLLNAAFEGDEAHLIEVLPYRTDLNARDQFGATALAWMAVKGRANSVHKLLEAGARPDIPNKSGVTALMHAAQFDHVEVVRLLLNHGADPRIRDARGRTALSLAQQFRRTEVIRLLRAKRYPNPHPGGLPSEKRVGEGG